MIDLKERIGVHILTRNRLEYFAVLCSSLLRQTYDKWDLIVVDNSDRPVEQNKIIYDLFERMRLEGHRVLYKFNEDNNTRTNIGASRNICIEMDDLDYGCRIDDDSWLEPDYLERLYNVIKEDKNIGAVGGIVPYLGSNAYYKFFKEGDIFNKVHKFGTGWVCEDDGHWHVYGGGVFESHHLRSSFLFRKKAAIDAGLHPLEYGSTGFREETDFSLRIMDAGYRLVTDSEAKCWHLIAVGKNRQDNMSEVQIKNQRNEMIFQQKMKSVYESLEKKGVIQ